MKLTSEQIEALREFGDWAEQVAEKLARGETVALEREVKRWEPRVGEFSAHGSGRVFREQSALYVAHGTSRGTREEAERLAHDQRIFNRLHAYREEFAPGYVAPNHGETTWCIAINDAMTWYPMSLRSSRCPTDVYMPGEVCQALCRKLNSGEVVL